MLYAKKTIIILIVAVIAAAVAAPSWGIANPLSRSTGARPLALGNAYVALSDDASGLFTNPAGLASIKDRKLISMYSQPGSGISFTELGAAFPLLGGAIGLGYRSNIVAGVAVSAEVADFTNGEILLAYSRKVRENLALGLDMRFLSQGLSKTVTGFEGLNGSGSSYGLFLKYNFRPGVDLGAAWQDLGGKINYNDNTSDDLTAKLTLGANFTPHPLVLLNLDFSQSGPQPVLLHSGVEWQARPFMALRLGADQSTSGPNTVYTNITTGIGLLFSGITLDYTLYRQGDPTGLTTNYFALGYIGAAKAQKPLKVSPEAAVVKEIKKVRLVHFKDIPADHPDRLAIEHLASLGIINYYSDETFRPRGPVSRAELVMLLVRLNDLPLPKVKQQIFSDVPADSWAADYVQSAYENNITKGYEDNTFKPRQAVTRGMLAAFLKKFDGLRLSEGVTSPEKDITRAELAELLYKTKLVKNKISQFIFEN
ncbi:MAG: S-layer homology domain-containing protein [Candidatus Margulisiibacteriota bacterium]